MQFLPSQGRTMHSQSTKFVNTSMPRAQHILQRLSEFYTILNGRLTLELNSLKVLLNYLQIQIHIRPLKKMIDAPQVDTMFTLEQVPFPEVLKSKPLLLDQVLSPNTGP